MKIKHLLFAISLAVVLPQGTNAQEAPQWLTETQRQAIYPRGVWYVGFAEDRLPNKNANVTQALDRIKSIAKKNLGENIKVTITGETRSRTTETGAAFNMETEELIRAIVGNVEIVNMQIYDYHDKKANRVYALAVVKKADISNYYATPIETAIGIAERNLDIARQYAAHGQRKEAFEALDICQKHISSVAAHRERLKAVDHERATRYAKDSRIDNIVKALPEVKKSAVVNFYVSRIKISLDEIQRNFHMHEQHNELNQKIKSSEALSVCEKHIDSCKFYRSMLTKEDAVMAAGFDDRVNEWYKKITEARKESKNAARVFIISKEVIQGAPADVIAPGLYVALDENGIMAADGKEDADYVINIDAKVCNQKSDRHFHYANACVKITLTNAKTGKNEVTTNISGSKDGGANEWQAGVAAFKIAVPEIWARVKDNIMGN